MEGRRRIIDTHIHLWTPDTERFPLAPNAPAIHEHLQQPGTAEDMVKTMRRAGISGALVVQPVNYGQDYSYMEAAATSFPGFFKGMLVADPTSPLQLLSERVQANPSFWVGVRLNPYKWADENFSDSAGHALFQLCGELGLPVGLMPFKGLARHAVELKALMEGSPRTVVLVDHWGFFLQPATGFGEREIHEESFEQLLQLGQHFPQVHVKLSGMFRNSADTREFASLDERFERLLGVFGAERLLWGTDAPYLFDFCDHAGALEALDGWGSWRSLSDPRKDAILSGNAERVFGTWSDASNDEL